MSSPEPTPAEQLARRMGIKEPDADLLEALDDALDDAVAEVEGYLGRSITPVQKVAYGCWPVPGGWDLIGVTGTLRRIVSAVPEVWPDTGLESGTFTVTYEVGLDYLVDADVRPIRRYVQAAAANNPMLLAYLSRTGERGEIKSVNVSTEGQSKSVTYSTLSYGGGGTAGADAPGALPSRSTLDRWRLANRHVHQAPDQRPDPRVYGGDGALVRDRDGFWNAP